MSSSGGFAVSSARSSASMRSGSNAVGALSSGRLSTGRPISGRANSQRSARGGTARAVEGPQDRFQGLLSGRLKSARTRDVTRQRGRTTASSIGMLTAKLTTPHGADQAQTAPARSGRSHISVLGVDETDVSYGITPKAAARAFEMNNVTPAMLTVSKNDIAFFPVSVLHEGVLQSLHAKVKAGSGAGGGEMKMCLYIRKGLEMRPMCEHFVTVPIPRKGNLPGGAAFLTFDFTQHEVDLSPAVARLYYAGVLTERTQTLEAVRDQRNATEPNWHYKPYPYRKNVDQGTEMMPGATVINLGEHRDAVEVKPLLWLVSREQVRRRVDVHNQVNDWETHVSALVGGAQDYAEGGEGGDEDEHVRHRKRSVLSELMSKTGAFTGFRSLQRKFSGIRHGHGRRPELGPAPRGAQPQVARIAGGSAVPVGLDSTTARLGEPTALVKSSELPDGHISRKSLAKIDFRFDELPPAVSGHDAQRVFREAIDLVTDPEKGGNPEFLYEVREEMHAYAVEATTSAAHYVRWFERNFGYKLMVQVMPKLVSLVKDDTRRRELVEYLNRRKETSATERWARARRMGKGLVQWAKIIQGKAKKKRGPHVDAEGLAEKLSDGVPLDTDKIHRLLPAIEIQELTTMGPDGEALNPMEMGRPKVRLTKVFKARELFRLMRRDQHQFQTQTALVTDDTMGAAVLALRRNNAMLTHLNLSGLGLGPTSPGMDGLCRGLMQNTNLTSLDMRDNALGNAGALRIAGAIEALRPPALDTALRKLVLSNNTIGTKGAAFLISAGKLTELNLENNCVNEQDLSMTQFPWTDESSAYAGMTKVAQMLLKNKALKRLTLSRNSIGDLGAKLLGGGLAPQESLGANETLETLDIAENRITAEGAETLAALLDQNKTLTRLELNGNNIETSGLEHLAEFVRSSGGRIVKLGVERNRAGVMPRTGKRRPDFVAATKALEASWRANAMQLKVRNHVRPFRDMNPDTVHPVKSKWVGQKVRNPLDDLVATYLDPRNKNFTAEEQMELERKMALDAPDEIDDLAMESSVHPEHKVALHFDADEDEEAEAPPQTAFQAMLADHDKRRAAGALSADDVANGYTEPDEHRPWMPLKASESKIHNLTTGFTAPVKARDIYGHTTDKETGIAGRMFTPREDEFTVDMLFEEGQGLTPRAQKAWDREQAAKIAQAKESLNY